MLNDIHIVLTLIRQRSQVDKQSPKTARNRIITAFAAFSASRIPRAFVNRGKIIEKRQKKHDPVLSLPMQLYYPFFKTLLLRR